MRPRYLILSAMPLPLAAPALAQQDSNSSDPVFTLPRTAPAPADDPRRQGPELDVFRGAATPTPAPTPPPVIAPTVTPNPTPAPAPVRTPAARAPAPRTTPPEPPRAERPSPMPAPRAETPAAAQPDIPVPANAANAAAPTPAETSPPLPIPADNAAATAAPQATPWPWIAAGIAALVILAAACLLLRRRRPRATEEAVIDAPEPAAPQPEPVVPARAVASPATAPAPAPVPAPDAADRPWIDMALDIGVARYSLIGVTVGYTLILHNRGDRPAQDILVRGLLGNAGAQQDELLRYFFNSETGLPLHSAVSIVPGETVRIAGELRLAADRIVPVQMGNRALLVPLAAFDAHYRWADDQDAPLGSGRTGRAFIVGQEQEPPADRLAPFRLDQGPRQYRRPAARAAAELPPA